MAATIAATTVATSMPALAAFDANYYAKQNPDVVAVVGTTPKALENHYIAQSRYESYLSMLDDKDENKYREAY